MKSTQFQFNDLDIIRTLKRDISFLAQPMHNLSIIGTILSIYWYMAIKVSKRKEMNDFYVKQSSIPCNNEILGSFYLLYFISYMSLVCRKYSVEALGFVLYGL